MICAGTDFFYALKSKVRQSVWCSIKVYSNFTSFLVKKILRKKVLAKHRYTSSRLLQMRKTRGDLCKNFLVNSNTFSSAQTGKTYFATNKQRFSCNSTNVVCLVHCKKCYLHYVGSTTTEFKVSTGTTNHL